MSLNRPKGLQAPASQIAKLLPPEAVRELVEAAAEGSTFRSRDIARVTRQLKRKYPQFFQQEAT